MSSFFLYPFIPAGKLQILISSNLYTNTEVLFNHFSYNCWHRRYIVYLPTYYMNNSKKRLATIFISNFCYGSILLLGSISLLGEITLAGRTINFNTSMAYTIKVNHLFILYPVRLEQILLCNIIWRIKLFPFYDATIQLMASGFTMSKESE